jgi:hypothetical protein
MNRKAVGILIGCVSIAMRKSIVYCLVSSLITIHIASPAQAQDVLGPEEPTRNGAQTDTTGRAPIKLTEREGGGYYVSVERLKEGNILHALIVSVDNKDLSNWSKIT